MFWQSSHLKDFVTTNVRSMDLGFFSLLVASVIGTGPDIAYFRQNGTMAKIRERSPTVDPLQFTYRANISVNNAVNMALHFILHDLDSPGLYARITVCGLQLFKHNQLSSERSSSC